jgi:hypothetical protein
MSFAGGEDARSLRLDALAVAGGFCQLPRGITASVGRVSCLIGGGAQR